MFNPRLVAASLSGESDASWAQTTTDYCGFTVLGGLSIDEQAQRASKQLLNRDRTEFVPADPIDFIDAQLSLLSETPVLTGMNVRSTTVEPVSAAARVCAAHDAVLEVNAHCRQPELCAVGCGESLLADTDRLVSYVEAAVAVGATVSVKVRAEVPSVSLSETATAIEEAGGSMIHVDAMDSPESIETVVGETDLFVIANNGVRTPEDVTDYLHRGADAVSVARPTRTPDRLTPLRDAADAWSENATI